MQARLNLNIAHLSLSFNASVTRRLKLLLHRHTPHCCRAMAGVVNVSFCLFLECAESVRAVQRRRGSGMQLVAAYACPVHSLTHSLTHSLNQSMLLRLAVVHATHHHEGSHTHKRTHTLKCRSAHARLDDGRAHFGPRQDQRSRGRQSGRHTKALPHVRAWAGGMPPNKPTN